MKSLTEIAYAENERESIKVVDVCALSDHILRVRFSDGEIKEVDFKLYLEGRHLLLSKTKKYSNRYILSGEFRCGATVR